MKTRPFLIAASATAAALLLAAGIATADGRGDGDRGAHGQMRMAHADGDRHGGGMRGAGGMHRGGADGPMIQLMERYDTDGDGALTVDEITAARSAQLSEFDADGDGSLSLEEYQALWLDVMRERMVDRFQQHDADGDGSVTQEEFARDLSRMVERRDRNDDGMLNAEDMRGPRYHMDGDDHPMGEGDHMRGGDAE